MEGLLIVIVFTGLLAWGAIKDHKYDQKYKEVKQSIAIHREFKREKKQ